MSKSQETPPSEIKEIMNCLGRGNESTIVSGTHLSKILLYLQMQKVEDYQKTISKLAVMLGMKARYVREDYLEGLESWGIIVTEINKNTKLWHWIGKKTFDNWLGTKAFIKKPDNNGEK